MIASADREIRLGIWKIHMLHHAASREVYGLWLLEELAEHGHRLSPGTLYPALARMEANGWLERTSDTERAKARRGYRITPKGRRLLGQLRRDVTELYEEVVLGREPSHDPKVSPKTPGSRSRGRSPEAASARSPKADTGSA